MKAFVPRQIVTAVHGNFHPAGEPRILHSAFVELKKWAFPNLVAPYWRWYWNDRPGAVISINKRSWALRPERIFLIPPQTSFSTYTKNPVTHFYIHFTLPSAYTPALPMVWSHPTGPQEARLIGEFKNRLKGSPDFLQWDVSLRSNLLVNLALLTLPKKSLLQRPAAPQIDHVLQLMQTSYPMSVPNAKLAAAVNMSVSAFLREFRGVTRQSPHQHLLSRRIENACQLMHQPNLSIEQIAERTGFCDRFHFSLHFKRRLHVTPSEFRRQVNVNLSARLPVSVRPAKERHA